jgi:hypothetical protein
MQTLIFYEWIRHRVVEQLSLLQLRDGIRITQIAPFQKRSPSLPSYSGLKKRKMVNLPLLSQKAFMEGTITRQEVMVSFVFLTPILRSHMKRPNVNSRKSRQMFMIRSHPDLKKPHQTMRR